MSLVLVITKHRTLKEHRQVYERYCPFAVNFDDRNLSTYFFFLSINGEGQSPVVYMIPVITDNPGANYRGHNAATDSTVLCEGFQRSRAPQDTPQESGNFPPAGHFQEANSLAG